MSALIGVLALALVARTVSAQASPDSVHHRNDCRLAAQTLATGDPAPKTAWALQVIRSCGDQGSIGTTIAAALSRLRFSSDTGQLLPLWNATFGYVDGAVYSAALAVAADASASPTARAVNLLTVLTQLQPDAYVTFQGLFAPTANDRCQIGHTYDVPNLKGPIALPPDAATQASSLAGRIQSDPNAPALVRAAATCLAQATSS